MRRRSVLGLVAAVLVVPAAVRSQPQPNFSGTWFQSNERCVPKRTGDVIRVIGHHGSEFVVETTASRSSGPVRHAVQQYSIGGGPSVSIGADGDEFHTSIVWRGQSLVFSVEEHERDEVLFSTGVWSLIENGSALQVDRENRDASEGGTRKQTLLYLRQSPDAKHP